MKTGVKVPVPKEIIDYIRTNDIRKLRFMMYLPKNKKERKKEEKAKSIYEKAKEKRYSTKNLYPGFLTGNVH